MNELKKIPKFLYVLVVAIIVAIVFCLTIGTSLINNAPKMISEHEENVKKIAEYDSAISKQDSIEAEIKKNQQEFETKQKELFVDLDTSSKEIEKYCSDRGITLKSYNITEPTDDTLNRRSSVGYPVKTVNITLSYNGTYDTALSMLKYFEKTSKGCYYVKSCALSNSAKAADEYEISLNLTLYYYDTTEAAATTATEAATTA